MSNPMKYIKDLEAAGFQRNQTEAQVQMVMDAVEGELVTKNDLALFKEHNDRKFGNLTYESDRQFSELEQKWDRRFNAFEQYCERRFTEIDHRFNALELRLIVKLGMIVVSSTTVAVAVLAWLIKIN